MSNKKSKPKPGERIYVECFYFSGYATVTDIVNCAFYPVQITLEIPDTDGHSTKRVGWHEIKNEEER